MSQQFGPRSARDALLVNAYLDNSAEDGSDADADRSQSEAAMGDEDASPSQVADQSEAGGDADASVSAVGQEDSYL